jgi:hypothetical protein
VVDVPDDCLLAHCQGVHDGAEFTVEAQCGDGPWPPPRGERPRGASAAAPLIPIMLSLYAAGELLRAPALHEFYPGARVGDLYDAALEAFGTARGRDPFLCLITPLCS